MSMPVILKLPADLYERVLFSPSVTVRLAKTTIEKLYGIPCEIQILEFNGMTLADNDTLEDIQVSNESEIIVTVDHLWLKLVTLTLQGYSKSLGRRVSVPMQQIGEDTRVFVTMFISASRGLIASLKTMLTTYKDFDLNYTTKITGRTLLHAAISSSSLKCVEEIKKRAGTEFEQLLQLTDKSGETALDNMCRSNVRMLNYINKFISKQIPMDDRISTSTVEKNEELNRENTFTLRSKERELKERTIESQCKDNKLVREKSNNTLKVNNNHNNNPEIRSVSPIITEKTKTGSHLTVGKAQPDNGRPVSPSLPILKTKVKSNGDNTKPFQLLPSMPKSPRPPSRDIKRRAVAGVLAESNLRKFSASKHARGSSDGEIILRNKALAPRRPHSGQKINTTNTDGNETPKVRRISRIQSPSLSVSADDIRVIEMEKDRIEKPWNQWIRAVTVDADDPKAIAIASSPQPQRKVSGRKISRDRKTSFDDWVLYKAQEQAALELQLANEHHEESENKEAKLSNAKSFEQWKKEKAEYERVEKEKRQEELDELLDLKLAKGEKEKGKTYAQWQKETEERVRKESVQRNQEIQKTKEDQKVEQDKRRKESVAKYQAWLREKEIQAVILREENEKKKKVKTKKKSTINYDLESTKEILRGDK